MAKSSALSRPHKFTVRFRREELRALRDAAAAARERPATLLRRILLEALAARAPTKS